MTSHQQQQQKMTGLMVVSKKEQKSVNQVAFI